MKPFSYFTWARNAMCVLALGLWTVFLNQLNSQVVEAWVQHLGHQSDSEDEAYAVVVDPAGGVIVAGDSFNVATRSDMLIIKYSSAGVPLWTNFYSGPGYFDDYARAVAVGTSGTVIVAGTSRQSRDDYVTIAYSSGGLPLWTNYYDGDAGQDDEVRAMAVDGNGNIFVTGRSGGIGSSWDYATIAYSSAGMPLWTNRYLGPGLPGLDYDEANDIVVDANGNVFVTGASLHDPNRDEDYLTIAYSSTGQLLWTNIYNGPGSSSDRAMAIAVDTSGNVFVTGDSADIGGAGYATIAYSGAGVPLWTNRYNSTSNSLDYAKAVAVDGNGKVFVTGSSSGPGGDDGDYVTIAYSASTGVTLWTNRYDGPAHSQDEAMAIEASASGQVFVTGYSAAETNLFGSPHNHDYATVAYDRTGLALWTNRYSGTANEFDAPRSKSSLALGADGSVVVTGRATEASSGSIDSKVEFVTVKYAPARLEIRELGNQVVLSWPGIGFGLQSAPAITGLFTNIPGAVSPFTNSITSGQMYFRLMAN